MKIVRLHGFSIIEGIVAMVILSLLLTVASVVFVRYYQVFPAMGAQYLKVRTCHILDSMVQVHHADNQEIKVNGLMCSYQTFPLDEFTRFRRAVLTCQDTLGKSSECAELVTFAADEN